MDSPRRARALGALIALAAMPALAGPAAAAPATSGPLAIPGNTIWAGDYETGNTSQWHGCQRSGSWSINVQSSFVREGNYAARYELRDGDTPIDANERSECQRSTGEVEGSDRWYSWSTYLDPSFPVSNGSGWATFTQWHTTGPSSPPVGFFLEGGKIVLKLQRQSVPGTFIGTINPWGIDLASNRGKWLDFAMHIKWSGSDSVGSIELWLNGVKQTMNWPLGGSASTYGGLGTSVLRARTLVPGYGAYFKHGYYRAVGLSGTAIIYQDGFRVTDGKGSGPYPAPEGSTPPPPPSTTTPTTPTEPTPPPPPPPPAVTVAVSPTTASVQTGTTKQFTASGSTVTWSVNGVNGGNATVGTVSPAGLYTAPAAVPSGAVSVTATSTVDTSKKASAAVTVTAPPPPPPVTNPTPPAPPATLDTPLFTDGFEGTAPGASGSPWTIYRQGSNAAAVVTSPVAAGKKAMDFRKNTTGNYTYAGRSFAASNNANVTMRVYLRDNTISNGTAHVITRVVSGLGSMAYTPRYEVGVSRTSAGALRWSVWSMDSKRVYSATAFSSTTPQMNRWYTLKLTTTWNSSSSQGRLQIDDGTDLRTPILNRSGFRADRLEIGVPWTNTGSRLRVTFDDVSVDNGSVTTTAAVKQQRYAKTRISGYTHKAAKAAKQVKKVTKYKAVMAKSAGFR